MCRPFASLRAGSINKGRRYARPALPATASSMSGKLAHDFKGRVHFGFVVVDLAGLANAERVTLGTRPDPPFDPQLLFEFGGRHAFDAVDHGGAGQFGVYGGTDSGARDLLQAA